MFAPFNGWIVIFVIMCVLGFFALKLIINVIYFIIGIFMVTTGSTKEQREKKMEREEKRRKYEARAREKARIDGRL